jgi:hypothetical protein
VNYGELVLFFKWFLMFLLKCGIVIRRVITVYQH